VTAPEREAGLNGNGRLVRGERVSCRHPVNGIALRPQRSGSVPNKFRLASRRHGRGAKGSGKATQAGAGSNHKRRPPESVGRREACSNSHSDATACAGFGPGEAQGARANQQQLYRRLSIELQVRQPAVEWMLCYQRHFLGHVQKRAQLQDLRRVHGTRTADWLAPQWHLVVLQQPARRGKVGRGESSGRRNQALRTSTIAHILRSARVSMRFPGTLTIVVALFGLLGQSARSETATRHEQAKPKQVAQRQIICTTSIGGCREVKPGCWVEPMQSKFHDASGHQKEVCPGDPR
jgi:hypothetical protein